MSAPHGDAIKLRQQPVKVGPKPQSCAAVIAFGKNLMGRCCRGAGTSGPVVVAAQHPRLQRRILKASALAEAAARSRLEYLMNHRLGGAITHQTHVGADLIRSLIICPILHERTFTFLGEIRLKFCITDFGVTLRYFSRRASASDSSSSLRWRI